jgi:5'-3' exonuclease
MNVLEYRQNSSNNPDHQHSSPPADFHVIDGFLRRICKLLYFGVKPVFVFDGSTPSIKKKTLIIRRRLRHKQQINYGKAAE